MAGLKKHLGRILLEARVVFVRMVRRELVSKKVPALVGLLAGSLCVLECLALGSDYPSWLCLLSAVVPVLSFQSSTFRRFHSWQHLSDQSLQQVSL